LTELRLWLEQVELGIRSLPSGDRLRAERDVVHELEQSTTQALNFLFERFEEISGRIPPERRPAHAAFCRRQLHPLLLASPFMHRIYVKPLGYAGDYEMVNMILRDPCEGGSLFAKLLNVFILSQVPAVAHRNRVAYLTRRLLEETNRCFQHGRTARILNFGCGPAKEVQNFLTEHALSEHAHLDLVDFDEEALAHVVRVTEEIKLKHGRRTALKPIKNSVQQVLRQLAKPIPKAREYDFVYCAGLFDYLNNRTCKSLVAFFYDLLAPDGLLVVTNVETQHPIKNIMEYIFEWHLTCRSGKELAALAPDRVPGDAVSTQMETSGGNVFLEIRKPRVTA
jgi:extracellular factor (EF) 3-hydroxypalmitic acid methyl ester biosynthesis protein